jgi:selenocysteine lyase/cysteine desulfurase
MGVAPSAGLARTAVLGLARSVGWIEMYVGLDFVYARTEKLVARLFESLQKLGGVNVEKRAPAVVTFSVARWPIEDVIDELRRRVFAIVSLPADAQSVQASVGWFNTESEIDAFVGAVRDIAANTPDSIPRRLPLLGE